MLLERKVDSLRCVRILPLFVFSIAKQLWMNCGLGTEGTENTRTWHFPCKCSAPSDAAPPKEQCGKAIVLLNYLPTLLFCIPGFQFTIAK